MKKTIGILLGCLCILLLESGVKRIEKKPALTITPSRLQLFVDQHTDPYTIKIVYTLNIPHGFILPVPVWFINLIFCLPGIAMI